MRHLFFAKLVSTRSWPPCRPETASEHVQRPISRRRAFPELRPTVPTASCRPGKGAPPLPLYPAASSMAATAEDEAIIRKRYLTQTVLGTANALPPFKKLVKR